MRQAGPNWPAVKLFCRNSQYNQYSATGTPQHGSLSGQDAVTPPSPHRGHFFKAILWSRGTCGHGSIQLPAAAASRADGCPWGWWLPTGHQGLVTAHGAGGCPWAWWISTSLTTAYTPVLQFYFTQHRLTKLRALCCGEVCSSTVINGIFASDITYCGI